jgi:hypothetical protein
MTKTHRRVIDSDLLYFSEPADGKVGVVLVQPSNCLICKLMTNTVLLSERGNESHRATVARPCIDLAQGWTVLTLTAELCIGRARVGVLPEI